MILKEQKLSTTNKFTSSLYPSSGLFKNTDDVGCSEVFYVNKIQKVVVFIDTFDSFITTIDNTPPTPTESKNITEDFVLKLVSVITHDTKPCELNDC